MLKSDKRNIKYIIFSTKLVGIFHITCPNTDKKQKVLIQQNNFFSLTNNNFAFLINIPYGKIQTSIYKEPDDALPILTGRRKKVDYK